MTKDFSILMWLPVSQAAEHLKDLGNVLVRNADGRWCEAYWREDTGLFYDPVDVYENSIDPQPVHFANPGGHIDDEADCEITKFGWTVDSVEILSSSPEEHAAIFEAKKESDLLKA